MNNTVLIAGIAFSAIFVSIFAFDDAYGAAFVKYDGIDGEATDKNHNKWIDILSFEWETSNPSPTAEHSRKRGAAVVADVVISMEYDKSSPKLQEASLTGKVIPKMEIDFTRQVPCTTEPTRDPSEIPDAGELCDVVYLKYELKNVRITSYQTSWTVIDERPEVVVGNNFEEIKVTYTEYDEAGSSKGNVEYTWKIGKGEK